MKRLISWLREMGTYWFLWLGFLALTIKVFLLLVHIIKEVMEG